MKEYFEAVPTTKEKNEVLPNGLFKGLFKERFPHNPNHESRFFGTTIEELLSKIKKFYCAEDGDLRFEEEGQVGRLDVVVIEDHIGIRPSASEIKMWKEGEYRLFSALYTFMIEKVVRTRAPLFESYK